MTALQVREISSEVYMEHNKQIINGLIKIKPQMTTKEAVNYLGCSRQWLSSNRELFAAKVLNRRGDLSFSAAKVVEYKRKNLIE